MSPHRKIALKVIAASTTGPVVGAPPVLKASDHTMIMPAEIAAPFCCMQRTVKPTIWRSTALNAARTINERVGVHLSG
jgi:hypothetical protein